MEKRKIGRIKIGELKFEYTHKPIWIYNDLMYYENITTLNINTLNINFDREEYFLASKIYDYLYDLFKKYNDILVSLNSVDMKVGNYNKIYYKIFINYNNKNITNKFIFNEIQKKPMMIEQEINTKFDLSKLEKFNLKAVAERL
jgi:hypothetical protein